MGQYYMAIILADNNIYKHEIIRFYIHSLCGAKLMEHSYIGNNFIGGVEFLFTQNGPFYKSRLVWAGDYADPEPELENNLYELTTPEKEYILKSIITPEYKYIINHTKKIYIDKDNYISKSKKRCQEYQIHPLPLLVAEGNGRGGGDYSGINKDLVGTWSRDVISVDKDKPDDYTEFDILFIET
jgi:hypothetical protein